MDPDDLSMHASTAKPRRTQFQLDTSRLHRTSSFSREGGEAWRDT